MITKVGLVLAVIAWTAIVFGILGTLDHHGFWNWVVGFGFWLGIPTAFALVILCAEWVDDGEWK